MVIERPHKKCRVTVHTARPGVLDRQEGRRHRELRSELAKLTQSEVHLNIVEVRKPEIDATLVAETIAQQLERRVAFRRAMKRAVQSALRLGALGIRINCSGRLGGAEIARVEWYREGRVPLHTLRADIDFGYGVAQDGLRRHRRQGVDLQGRDHGARPDGRREAARRGPGSGRRRRPAPGRWRCRDAGPNGRPSSRERTERSMLQPARTKYRKAFKGRIHGNAKGGTSAEFWLATVSRRWSRSASRRARSRPLGGRSRVP